MVPRCSPQSPIARPPRPRKWADGARRRRERTRERGVTRQGRANERPLLHPGGGGRESWEEEAAAEPSRTEPHRTPTRPAAGAPSSSPHPRPSLACSTPVGVLLPNEEDEEAGNRAKRGRKKTSIGSWRWRVADRKVHPGDGRAGIPDFAHVTAEKKNPNIFRADARKTKKTPKSKKTPQKNNKNTKKHHTARDLRYFSVIRVRHNTGWHVTLRVA